MCIPDVRSQLTRSTVGAAETCPAPRTVVLIPGFLTPGGGPVLHDGRIPQRSAYWGAATQLVSPSRKIVEVFPSGVASLHDRACEVFYSLVGGQVDYGEDHAKQHGHARLGKRCGRRMHRAVHTTWSMEHAACNMHVLHYASVLCQCNLVPPDPWIARP